MYKKLIKTQTTDTDTRNPITVNIQAAGSFNFDKLSTGYIDTEFNRRILTVKVYHSLCNTPGSLGFSCPGKYVP